MKYLLFLGMFLMSSVVYGQVYDYTIKMPNTYIDYKPYQRTNIIVVGDFNKVNIQRDTPKIKKVRKAPKIDYTEYNKSRSFNPNKSLSEILRKDNKKNN